MSCPGLTNLQLPGLPILG